MAAASTPIFALTVTLSADVAAHRFVSPTGGAPSAGGNVLGVAQHAAKSGADIAVSALGTEVVEAGGTFAKGDALRTDANGKAIKHSGTHKIVARALSAATSGAKVEVLLITN